MPRVSKAHLEGRRQQILSAAMSCFARKGFQQTTMADIAAEAGVSDTLAYRYFSSKQDLIETAVRLEAGLTADGPELDTGLGDVRTFWQTLRTVNIRRFDDRKQAEAAMNVRFRSWAEAVYDVDIREEVLSRWRSHREIAEGLVRRAQEQGEIDARFDPDALVRVLLAIHEGLNLQAVLDPAIDLEKCEDVAMAMFFDCLKSGGDESRHHSEERDREDSHGC